MRAGGSNAPGGPRAWLRRPAAWAVGCGALLAAPGCGDEFSPEGSGGAAPLPPTTPFSLAVGSEGNQLAHAVAVDGAGNVVVTGEFEGEIDFGDGTLTANNDTNSDIFLAKYDANGQLAWSRRFGDTSRDRGMALAIDDAGNILLAASFGGVMEFDGKPLEANGYDILLAKLEPDEGEPIWHRVFTGQGDGGYAEPWSMALDADGNIALVGRFTKSLLLAEPHAANTDYDENRYDAFVAKLDPDGEPLWSTSFGDQWDDVAREVTIGPTGEVAAVGSFAGVATVLGHTWEAPSSASSRPPNAFVVQLGPEGDYRWSKSLGDDGYQDGYGVAIDSDGQTYVSGTFGGTIHFGGDARTSHGGYDLFLASYDLAGRLLWSWHAGDGAAEGARELAVTPDGQLAVAGCFAQALDVGTTVLHAEDEEDLFLAQLTTDAEPEWSRSFPGGGTEMLLDMAVDRAGSAILVGHFDGDVDFGQGLLSSQGDQDLFIAKLPPTGE